MKQFLKVILGLSVISLIIYFAILITPSLGVSEFRYRHHGGGHGFGMGIFWIFVILGLYLLIDQNDKPSRTYQDSAKESLKNRYARGEIDEETYLQTKRILEES